MSLKYRETPGKNGSVCRYDHILNLNPQLHNLLKKCSKEELELKLPLGSSALPMWLCSEHIL